MFQIYSFRLPLEIFRGNFFGGLMKKEKKESEIQTEILKLFKILKIWTWRNYNGPTIRGKGFFTKSLIPGSPDIMGIMPCGRSIQIEVKRDSKSARSKEQIEWIEKANKNKALALFAWDLQQIAELIKPCLYHCAPDHSDCWYNEKFNIPNIDLYDRKMIQLKRLR